VRGLQREAERSQRAKTVSEAHDLFSRFLQGKNVAIVHASGHLHIGGTAYFVWAYPPNSGCTAHRQVAVHRRTTSALTTSNQLLVQ
jgi:molybdopterin synthase catalytic subunit